MSCPSKVFQLGPNETSQHRRSTIHAEILNFQTSIFVRSKQSSNQCFFFPFSKNTGGQYQPKYRPILYKQNLKFIHNLSKKKYLAKLHKFWLILAGISLHPLVLRIPVTGEILEISAEKKKTCLQLTKQCPPCASSNPLHGKLFLILSIFLMPIELSRNLSKKYDNERQTLDMVRLLTIGMGFSGSK
jgi:hypothetical protein